MPPRRGRRFGKGRMRRTFRSKLGRSIRRGYRRMQGRKRIARIAKNVVEKRLTADNSIVDNYVTAGVTTQGAQDMVTAQGGASSVTGSVSIDLMGSPDLLIEIAKAIGSGTLKAIKFWTKSWTISTHIKNAGNNDLYIQRYRAIFRRDVPFQAAQEATLTRMQDVVNFGFADNAAVGGAVYTTVPAQTVFGVTPFQNPRLVERCKLRFIKTYHLRGGQELKLTRKRLKQRFHNTEGFSNPGNGNAIILAQKGNSFDFYVLRGGIVAGANVAGVPTNPTVAASPYIIATTVRIHYSYLQDNVTSARAPAAGGYLSTTLAAPALAAPLVIPEMAPAANEAPVIM